MILDLDDSMMNKTKFYSGMITFFLGSSGLLLSIAAIGSQDWGLLGTVISSAILVLSFVIVFRR
jgi:hypothetical protein